MHLMLRAFDEAEADSFLGTDEASLLERAGRHGRGCGGVCCQLQNHTAG